MAEAAASLEVEAKSQEAARPAAQVQAVARARAVVRAAVAAVAQVAVVTRPLVEAAVATTSRAHIPKSRMRRHSGSEQASV
jgi:hypothetical protein